MFRLIKKLVIISFIFTLPLAATFYYSSPEERAGYLSWVEQKTGWAIRDKAGLISRRMEVVRDQVSAIDPRAVIDQVRSGEIFQEAVNCGKTITKEIKQEPGSDIYRWVDEQGGVHFGDKRPGTNAGTSNLSETYKSKRQYFSLKVIRDTASLPAFIEDRVSADVRQIYNILARDLNLDHLRQVFLNVRIIANQDDFQDYKNRIAPGIRTNSGFYSSKTNEAVVFQGNSPDVMRAIIRHESSHVIMAGLYGSTPSWFNEGFAEYFERLETGGQVRKIKPAANHLRQLDKLVEQSSLNLRDYLEQPARQWYAGHLPDNYALAWSIIYFLMSHSEGQDFLKGMHNQLAENVCWQFSSIGYFENNYPGGFSGFELAWKDWLAGNKPSAHRY